MRNWEKLLYGILKNEDTFREEVRAALSNLNLSIKDFSTIAKVPTSTLYKIMSNSKQDIRLSSAREIILKIKEIEQGCKTDGNSIALVADREALENLRKDIVHNGRHYKIVSYPSVDIEEAIIQGVNAERDGVHAIICGPIAAYTLGKIVRIPIIALRLKPEQLQSVIDTAIKKLT